MPSWEVVCSTAQTSCDCKGKFFTFFSSDKDDSELWRSGKLRFMLSAVSVAVPCSSPDVLPRVSSCHHRV